MLKRTSLVSLALTLLAAGCTSVPLKEAGTLSSYERLGPAKGSNTNSRTYVDGTRLGGVKTVTIVPAKFSSEAASKVKSEKDRNLVTNAINRSLCVGLSDGYRVVGPREAADLRVRATVTDIVPTDKGVAGVSTITSLGTGAFLPVGLPRLPFGLGGIAVEAEAVDASGAQRAAVVWSRGANSITNSARVSEVGDAYSLGSAFGKSFARVLVDKREVKKLTNEKPKKAKLARFRASNFNPRSVADQNTTRATRSDERQVLQV